MSLQRLGLEAGASPTLFEVLGAFAVAVDTQSEKSGGRTDLGEMAQHAAAESFVALVGSELPTLFGPPSADVRTAIGKRAARAEGVLDLSSRFLWCLRALIRTRIG
jgi:hypothetical protein